MVDLDFLSSKLLDSILFWQSALGIFQGSKDSSWNQIIVNLLPVIIDQSFDNIFGFSDGNRSQLQSSTSDISDCKDILNTSLVVLIGNQLMVLIKLDSNLLQIHLGNLWSSSNSHKDIIELMLDNFHNVELTWLLDAYYEFITLFSNRLGFSQLKFNISVLHVVDNLLNYLLVKGSQNSSSVKNCHIFF